MGIVILYYGQSRLPLGDAYCIILQLPLVIAFMGRIFLKEKLPKMTPLIALFGIAGIILIAQPSWLLKYLPMKEELIDTDNVHSMDVIGLIALLIAVFIWGIQTLMVRKAQNSHFLQLELAASGNMVFVGSTALLAMNHFVLHEDHIGDFRADSWDFGLESIGIMLSVGCLGFLGLTLQVVGYQYGDATKVSWLQYLSLVFGFFVSNISIS